MPMTPFHIALTAMAYRACAAAAGPRGAVRCMAPPVIRARLLRSALPA
jgi:hypothetical protein